MKNTELTKETFIQACKQYNLDGDKCLSHIDNIKIKIKDVNAKTYNQIGIVLNNIRTVANKKDN